MEIDKSPKHILCVNTEKKSVKEILKAKGNLSMLHRRIAPRAADRPLSLWGDRGERAASAQKERNSSRLFSLLDPGALNGRRRHQLRSGSRGGKKDLVGAPKGVSVVHLHTFCKLPPKFRAVRKE